MGERKISLEGTAITCVLALGIGCSIVLLVNYFLESTSILFNLLFISMWMLGAFRNGNLIMYEGWFNDDNYFDRSLDNKYGRLIDLIIFAFIIYVFVT